MGTKCSMAVGVFFVELLAYQVSMVYAANWPYTCTVALFIYMRLFWVVYMTSSVISFAYFTHFSLEPMQVFVNGKRCFHSFIEFFVIHLRNQEVKI